MVYNSFYKVLFKEQLPVPWNGIYGAMLVEGVYCEGVEVDSAEGLDVRFTYKSRKNYNKLVKYLQGGYKNENN